MATFYERVLILCKTYPSPSATYAETSCVAGMTERGNFIRLFPVPFRLIQDEHQFRKWQWITVLMEKARDDHRPESHRIFIDKIECDSLPLPSGHSGWHRRMALLSALPIYDDFAAAETARQRTRATLAMVRPSRIVELKIRPTKHPDWTAEELAKLTHMQQQANLFSEEETRKEVALLEKIPFDFHYIYECTLNGQSKTYEHKLVDWEVGALYRRLRKQHGSEGWEAPFREKYERELPARDLILLLGTIHRFPDQWLIISVICPPRQQPEDLNQLGLF
ncbi:hypothetical protein [Comamonas sp.]|uniref:hypothetical protein n=1 Tax=Comamonas sp. TaxID=34028 RepID=UPI00289A16DB|nr:hypothetical protein [Comamonas sp.]